MATYTQAGRPLAVTTPLGPDVFLLVDLKGWEEISRPYVLELELAADSEAKIDFSKLLGQPIGIRVQGGGQVERPFHGICRAVEECESLVRFRRYRMEVVPKVWLLSLRSRTRIFQSMTVPDVLAKLFEGLDVSYMIQGNYQPRDYVVQYRESDFDFASRLMEEEGIWYYFRHKADAHTMVVADTPQGHDPLDGEKKMVFESADSSGREGVRVFRWEKRQEMRSGKITLWDHCFTVPGRNLEATQPIPDSVAAGTETHKLIVGGNDQLEVYDYPGAYAQRFGGNSQGFFGDSARTVKVRAEAEAAPAVTVVGESNCPHFSSGRKFDLSKHGPGDGSWVLTSVGHRANCALVYASGGDASDFMYSNSFRAIPSAATYRPARATPRPVVRGCQTATVVGPSGEEIHTDKYGRVKVQFHWDREGKKDAASSCWIRVATTWAGRQWGAIHIPRIGQEVVVDFLEGDPDRPIIIGSVYNAEQMPPYALPANKTQSGVKSRSTLKGSPDNFNEFRFEDKKGSEQVYLHAEKNQDIEVENDETHWVGHDRKKTIDHDETTLVKHDRTETVNHDETVTIDNNRDHTVGVDDALSVGQHRKADVGKNETLTVGENRSSTVGKDETLDVAGAQTETVGKDRSITVKGADKLDVSKDVSVKSGAKMKVEAANEITLVCGGASIAMKSNGDITIKGKNVTIEATAKVDVKASASIKLKGMKLDAEGTMTTVKGDGMTTIKGGAVMVN